MDFFKFSFISTDVGFGACLILNSYFIYLTLFRIKQMCATYKKMIIYFTAMGLFFSGFELFARPFSHNYNGALIFFSLSKDSEIEGINQLSIAIWSGFFTALIAFITIQFIYRCLCLFGDEFSKKFDRLPSIVWMSYPVLVGGIYCSTVYFLCQPDDYADNYLRDDFQRNYNLTIEDIPRFIMMPYDTEGNIRWNNLGYFTFGLPLINLHYVAIIYFGLKMHINMTKQLEKFSVRQRKLQRQFFKALVLQCLGPTVFLILPAVPILLPPLIPPSFGVQISWQTGWLYSLIQIFPPFDTIAFVIIVTEYRRIIKQKFTRFGSKTLQVHQTSSVITSDI